MSSPTAYASLPKRRSVCADKHLSAERGCRSEPDSSRCRPRRRPPRRTTQCSCLSSPGPSFFSFVWSTHAFVPVGKRARLSGTWCGWLSAVLRFALRCAVDTARAGARGKREPVHALNGRWCGWRGRREVCPSWGGSRRPRPSDAVRHGGKGGGRTPRLPRSYPEATPRLPRSYPDPTVVLKGVKPRPYRCSVGVLSPDPVPIPTNPNPTSPPNPTPRLPRSRTPTLLPSPAPQPCSPALLPSPGPQPCSPALPTTSLPPILSPIQSAGKNLSASFMFTNARREGECRQPEQHRDRCAVQE